MKRLLLFASLLMTMMSASAQKLIDGSLDRLVDARYVLVTWDFSETKFENSFMDEETWIYKSNSSLKEWDQDTKPEVLEAFISKANRELSQSPITLTDEDMSHTTRFVMVIAPQRLHRNGNNQTLYLFRDMERNGEIFAVVKLSTMGGRIGTLTNLLSDGYKEAGELMGSYLRKKLNKIYRRR